MIFKCSACGKEYDNISAAKACEEACNKAIVAKETEDIKDNEENEKREWLIDYIDDHARLVDQDKKEAQAIIDQLKDAIEAINEDKAVVEKAIKEFKENFDNYDISVKETLDSYSVNINKSKAKTEPKKVIVSTKLPERFKEIEDNFKDHSIAFGELSTGFLDLMKGLFE